MSATISLGCAQEITTHPSDPATVTILALGLPHTGTRSIINALTHLGISPIYDIQEVSKNVHAALWTRAIEAKASTEVPSWDRNKLDQLISGYKAIADFPAIMFPEDLMDAYPNAAIILTTTSEDAWVEGMSRDFVPRRTSLEESDHSPMAGLLRKVHRHCWDDDFERCGLDYFKEHNARVLESAKARGREVLEYMDGEGWAPLCEFLHLPVPESLSWPREDDV